MKKTNTKTKKDLPPDQQKELLDVLKARCETHMDRHVGLEWSHLHRAE